MKSQFHPTTPCPVGSKFMFRVAMFMASCICLLAPQVLKAQTLQFQRAVPAHQQAVGGVGGFASNTFKTKFDAEVQKHFDANNIPGMVVLMARDGMLTYKNTKGFADVENQIPVTANHVFRLASISKWIGGVMALRLEEQGRINLNAKANSLLDDLPSHHASRVVDFLTCRAGIRHYGERTSASSPIGWGDTVFLSASKALPNLWHDPLVNPAGAYHYSTHSYTFLGACMEKATSKSVPQLVKQLLRTPYNLNTLRTENLNYTAADRVKLYNRVNGDDPNSGNQLVSSDNLTWKFLGGGLESSAMDLLRLGIKVCDKQVVSHNGLERMLTRIDHDNGFGLGCNVGVENGNRIIAKDGGQTGASSYIWMAPDKRMVMVILTNIRQGKASSLGKKLRSIALGTTNAGSSKPDLVVKSFSKTASPYYQNGKLKIPFQMKVENVGKGGTPNKFVNGIRLGSNYRWTGFMQTIPPKGKKTVTGVIKINDPSKLQKGRTLTLIAMADAPIVAADTSIHPHARVFESVESNNGKILKVKVPGGISGLQVAQPDRDPNLNPQRTPTRTNPNRGRKTNPKSATRSNPNGAKRTNAKPATKTAPVRTSGGKSRKKGKRTNGKSSSAVKKSKPRRTNGKRPKIDKSKGETASGRPRKKN